MRNRYTLILTGLLLFSINTFSQLNGSRFDEVLAESGEEGISGTSNGRSSRYYTTKAQSVPKWFFHLPVSQNAVYAIGISDPEMDSTLGFEQALTRAKLLAGISCKSLTQLLCDFFYDETGGIQNVAFENYSRIKANALATANAEIVQSYRNQFDETLVLIKISPCVSPLEKENSIYLEVYKSEVESSVHGDFESIVELGINENTTYQPTFYQSTELGGRFSILSVHDTLKHELPIYNLSYHIPCGDSTQTIHLSHGLWKEYVASLANNIIHLAKNKPENIKVLSDRYQTTSYQKLTRGISNNMLYLNITGVSWKNDAFEVSLIERSSP